MVSGKNVVLNCDIALCIALVCGIVQCMLVHCATHTMHIVLQVLHSFPLYCVVHGGQRKECDIAFIALLYCGVVVVRFSVLCKVYHAYCIA